MKPKIYIPYLLLLFFLFTPFSIMVAQLNLEISFDKYQEEYQPLTEGDTLFGLNGEKWNNFDEFKEIPLVPAITIPGIEDVEFTSLILEPRGLSTMVHYSEENMVETIFYLGPLLLNFLSPLNDNFHSDQGYIIYQEGDGLINVEFRNVASNVEGFIGNGLFHSRFNFQYEYRYSDSRVRYLFGPSSITQDMEDYIREEYAFSALAFEQWLLEDESQDLWANIDLKYIVLFGLGEDPMISRPQSIETLPNFSLVSVPPENTVYEFNISPGTFTYEINQLQFNWNIWPNPADDFVNVSLESLPDGVTEIDFELYNSKGELLQTKTLQDSYLLDVGDYTPGVYFITLKSGGNQQTKKWVKK